MLLKSLSEALYTQLSVRWNRCVFNVQENAVQSVISGTERISVGKLFGNVGPTTEKPRCARIEVRDGGTMKSFCIAEQSIRRPGCVETGTRSSPMYSGAEECTKSDWKPMQLLVIEKM